MYRSTGELRAKSWQSNSEMQTKQMYSGVASYRASGRVPPRLPTYWRGIMHSRFAYSYSNSTRKVDVVWCGAQSGASGWYWQDCGQIFSARRQQLHCTKLRTLSENCMRTSMYGRMLWCAHCLIRPMLCYLLKTPLSVWFHILNHRGGGELYTHCCLRLFAEFRGCRP